MLTIAYIISIISVFFIVANDIKRRLIPDVWLWPLLLSGLYVCGNKPEHVIASILGYSIGFLMMIMLRKKKALGYGDVKLLAVMGLWLGIDGISFSVALACVAGIIWGLVKKQKYVPLAPFLFLGTAAWYLVSNFNAILLITSN